jgi:hypothetical protein
MVLIVMKQMARMIERGAAVVVLLLAVGLPYTALAQPAEVTPAAAQLLRTATDFLAQQQKFTLKVSVERPNKFRAQRTGGLVDQVFYYNGKSLTMYNPYGKYYATTSAPGTLEEMLDFAREKLDVVAPAGDLLYRNAYDILMQDVTAGFVVGEGVVSGVHCNHLAFRAPHVDWQIWIEEGPRPLVRKLVITTRDILNAPQFTVVTKNWNLKPKFSAATFSFKPRRYLQKAEFVMKDGTGPISK